MRLKTLAVILILSSVDLVQATPNPTSAVLSGGVLTVTDLGGSFTTQGTTQSLIARANNGQFDAGPSTWNLVEVSTLNPRTASDSGNYVCRPDTAVWNFASVGNQFYCGPAYGADSPIWYLSFYWCVVKMNWNSQGSADNMKAIARMSPTEGQANGNLYPQMGNTTNLDSNAQLNVEFTGSNNPFPDGTNGFGSIPISRNTLADGATHQYEMEYNDASSTSAFDGTFLIYRDGVKICTYTATISTSKAGQQMYQKQFQFIGSYFSTQSNGGNKFFYHDIIAQNGWERVILSTSSTWAAGGQNEFQPSVSRSPTVITVTYFQGATPSIPGGNVYAYVKNSDGTVNPNGVLVTQAATRSGSAIKFLPAH